jgi:hypothetical protein
MHRRHPAGIPIVLLVVALLAAACSGGDGDAGATTSTTAAGSSGGPTTTVPGGPDDPDRPEVTVQDRIRIEVLSSQPDRVTGEEARVRITPMAGGDPADLRATVDGRDVTASFAATTGDDEGAIEGIVTGLVEGTNSLTATDGDHAETLRLRAWPRQGPMISGPQSELVSCATEALGLGAGAEGTCAAPSRVTWRAITRGDEVVDVPDPASPPAGTVTVDLAGDDVAAVVRVEHGVVNRSTYELAVLDRAPGRPDRDLEPAWNGRLVFRFGDGCGASRDQGSPLPGAVDAALLRRGYAVVSASFTTAGIQCNDVVASETVMMVKERVVELLGEVDHTIGQGEGVGGAIAHLVVQNYPTLLDGVTTDGAYADTTSTANQVADCVLLDRYYGSTAGAALAERQRAAINGQTSSATCRALGRDLAAMFDPTACAPDVDPAAVYDATTNPTGLRCTFQDLNAVPFGLDPATGFAHRPVDNVGVQYGLDALNRGTVTVDQFLDLNEDIGGLDADGAPRRERSEVDVLGLMTMYETGRIAMGSGDLRKVPIIDVVSDDDGPGDLHHALAVRARLLRGAPAEAAPGHQIWLLPDGGAEGRRTASVEAIELVDEWLTGMQAARGDRAEALRGQRPDGASSRCATASGRDGDDVFDLLDGACLPADRPAGDPRMAAGGPEAGDVIKCELKAIDPLDYEASFTPAQFDRLADLFPTGVCDWGSAGAGQTLPTMPDRSFDDVEVPGDRA